MSGQNLTYHDLLQIVELIKTSSQFGEFHLKVGDIEVHLRRHGVAHQPAAAAPAQSAAVAVASAAERAAPPVYPESAMLIRSPMVGTFYRAPEPGAQPFVEVGQMVEPDTIVCIIEVMKLMHSMPAQHQGVVTHILVQDAEPVEYGQVLIVIEPNVDAPRRLPTEAWSGEK